MFFDHPSFVTSTCVCCSRLSRLRHCVALPSLLFGVSYLLGLLQLQVRRQRQHFTCVPFFMFLSVHFVPFLSQIQHLLSKSCLPASLPTLPLSDYSPLSLLFIQVNDFIQLSDFVRTDAGRGFKAEPGKKKGRKKEKIKKKGGGGMVQRKGSLESGLQNVLALCKRDDSSSCSTCERLGGRITNRAHA